MGSCVRLMRRFIPNELVSALRQIMAGSGTAIISVLQAAPRTPDMIGVSSPSQHAGKKSPEMGDIIDTYSVVVTAVGQGPRQLHEVLPADERDLEP